MKFGIRTSLRNKLLAFSILPFSLIAITTVFAIYTAIDAVGRMETVFEYNRFLDEILTEVETARHHLKSYLTTKNPEDLRKYIHGTRVLSEKSSRLDKNLSDGDDSLVERNIVVLLKRFIEMGDAAVSAKRGRNVPEYGNRYEDAERSVRFLKDRIDALMLSRANSSLVYFSSYSLRLRRIQTLESVLVGWVFAFSVSVIAYFSLKFTDPVMMLAAEADLIASGKYDSGFAPHISDDEIGRMTEAFLMMKESVRNRIDEIREKAILERSLMDARVKNLEMEGALRHAELSSLQARINPHFLFNTLNASIQLAVLEDAERTRLFLENLSSLMRYSFRDLDEPVTLADELSCLENFFFLLSIRFPDRYTFKVSIPEELKKTAMPKMIIQPLVENSVRHGLVDLERDALISLEAERVDGIARIHLRDNGKGIGGERVREIFEAADSGKDLRSESGGLGLSNVIRRLRIFTGFTNPLSIGRSDGGGLEIMIDLPIAEVMA